MDTEKLLRSLNAHNARYVVIASTAFFLLTVALSAGARADLVVEGRLAENGEDVTKSFPEAVLLFVPNDTKAGTVPRETIRCSPATLCDVPPGSYVVSVDSPEIVPENRPFLTVDKEDSRPFRLWLHVVRAATIEMAEGFMPAGSFVSAMDEKTGVQYRYVEKGPIGRLRIPGRPVILCGFEDESKPIGCQRVLATPGQTIRLTGFPQLPRGRGQLYVGLVYPSDDASPDVALALRVGERSLTPDVAVGRGNRFYAIWLDAPAGAGRLDLTSTFWTTAKPLEVEVPERRTAVQMRIPLIRKPSLKVRLAGAEVLGPGDIAMTLFRCEKAVDLDRPPIIPFCIAETEAAGKPSETFVFPGLAPAAYAVRWRKTPFEAAYWFDMRDGKARDETLAVELIELNGRVTLRGRGVAARLRWARFNSGATYQTKSDPQGNYSLHVAQGGPYAVGIRTENGRVSEENVAVAESGLFDFQIPANRVVIRVVTANGEAVPGARVDYNVSAPPPGGEQRRTGAPQTDREGAVTLPPLPAGILTAKVFAKGFRPAEIQPVEITEKTEEKEISVTLSAGAGIRIQILDTTGAPARGAVMTGAIEDALADDAGIVVFEQSLPSGTPLVAIDGKGRMGFFRSSGEQEQTFRMPPTGPPFAVRFLTPDGKPLKNRGVLVAVDGVLDRWRYLSQALAAGGDFLSGADGVQRVAGLPATGVLTVYPSERPDLAVTRLLPAQDEIVFTLLPEEKSNPPK